jgi:glycerophosphoryl diester phosphodiesterase
MRGTSHAPYLEGNTLDSLRAAARQGIGYVEVDLVATADGVLVTAHESYVRGCGTLAKMQLDQVLGCTVKGGLKLAELDAVLSLPFKGWFLDLKDTRGADPTRAAQAVESAARAVIRSGHREDAVLMLYEAAPAATRVIREQRLRAGLKGYPKDLAGSARMVDEASALGFEMLSVNTAMLSPELVTRSARQGIWHLPWSTNRSDVDHWRELARAGAGGLIVLHYDVAREKVAPDWVDVRSLVSRH